MRGGPKPAAACTAGADLLVQIMSWALRLATRKRIPDHRREDKIRRKRPFASRKTADRVVCYSSFRARTFFSSPVPASSVRNCDTHSVFCSTTMKTLTVRNVPDSVAAKLSRRATIMSSSVNSVVLSLLSDAVAEPGPFSKKRDLSEFCGVWTDFDLDEFNKATMSTRRIDQSDWE